MYNNQWKTFTTAQLVAELERLKQDALREAERYKEAERSGRYSNDALAERRQEMAEDGMIFGQLKQLIAERYALESQDQPSSTMIQPPLSPEEVASHLKAAKTHMKQHEYHLAVTEFNRILSSDPDNTIIYYERGLAFARLNKHQLAASDFTRVIQAQPDMLEAYWQRIRINVRLNQYEAQIADLTQILRLSPDNANVYCDRSAAFRLLKNYEAALRDIDEAIRLVSTDSNLYYLRAEVYMELGDYEHALADCELSLKYRPDEVLTMARIKEIKQKMASG